MPHGLSLLRYDSTPEKSLSPSDITPSPQSPENTKEIPLNEYEGFHSRFGLSRQPAESGSKLDQRNALHPYVRPLTVKDVEQCVYLESETFPANERCTEEKVGAIPDSGCLFAAKYQQFRYRLTKCPELSLGIFSIDPPKPTTGEDTASSHARPTLPRNGEVLIAHAVATKCATDIVTDDAMGYPSDWTSSSSQATQRGHREEGRTIALHSLAVLPAYQRVGIGSVLLKSYLQRMGDSAIADQVAIITHEHYIKFYEGFGFANKGKSGAQFGGGGWNDLVLKFSNANFRP
jgi:ribosomal protein S18 acetylase RimI-like enzyme